MLLNFQTKIIIFFAISGCLGTKYENSRNLEIPSYGKSREFCSGNSQYGRTRH